MKQRKKEQRYHNGIPIDSEEEKMVLLWFEELIEAGFVDKIERADSFVLSTPLTHTRTIEVPLKTKVKTIQKVTKLLDGHVYTPEFKVTWYAQGALKFVSSYTAPNSERPFIGNIETYIEVKPEYDRHNMTRLFVINQKWVWDKCGVFVNLVQPHKLFEQTFTPKAWLTTETGKRRVIHWQIKTLEEYLKCAKSA